MAGAYYSKPRYSQNRPGVAPTGPGDADAHEPEFCPDCGAGIGSHGREGEGTPMSESADTRPLTSVELLDAAVWREIGSEEAQPASAFLEALSRLVGRWLLVRSDAPEMDAVTVLCKARGYIAQQDASRLKGTEWSW